MNICMDSIEKMAGEFWLENAEAPTHLLLTPEQHSTFSKSFVPREVINKGTIEEFIGSAQEDYNISRVGLKNGINVDIVTCIQYNNSKEMKLPVMMRFE